MNRIFAFLLGRFRALAPSTRRLILLGALLSATTWSVGFLFLSLYDGQRVVLATSWVDVTLRHLVWGSRLLLLALWSSFFTVRVHLQPALDDFRAQAAQHPPAVAFFQALLHSAPFRTLYLWTSGYLFLLVALNASLSSALLLELLLDLSLLGAALFHLAGGTYPPADFYRSMALFGTINAKKIPIGAALAAVGAIVAAAVNGAFHVYGQRIGADATLAVAIEETKRETIRETIRQEAETKRVLALEERKRQEQFLAEDRIKRVLAEALEEARSRERQLPPNRQRSGGWPWQ